MTKSGSDPVVQTDADDSMVFTGSADMVYSHFPGPMSSSASFVLIHGLGMGRAIYTDFATALSAYGEVYVPDLPGFGDSPEPAHVGTMADTADVVAEFIRHLKLSDPILIGHSMGTQIIAEIAVRHRALVHQIVLIAPTVNREERTVGRQLIRMMQDLVGQPPKVLIKGSVQYLKTGPRWYVKKLKPLLEHDVESLYPRISARTLVLYGETDRGCPEKWSRWVADTIPGAELEVIPGRGHEAVIAHPQNAVDSIVTHLL